MRATQNGRQRAVVLGASGFIGVNLTHALVARGYDVVCFSRSESEHWPQTAHRILGQLAAPPAELAEAVNGALVFHLISTTRPSTATDAIPDEITENVLPTLRLLHATRDAGCRWVFVSSGGTVYGETEVPLIAEQHPTRPISSYGVAKLALEGYFAVYRALHGIDHVVLRLANPYGPHQSTAKGQGLVAALIERISMNEPIHIWGDGGNIRDYIYIDDAIDAIIAAAERGEPGEIYNIGSGRGTTINELIATVSTVLDKRAIIIHEPSRGVDVRRNVLDIGKLRAATGWAPKSSLREGISSTLRGASGSISFRRTTAATEG